MTLKCKILFSIILVGLLLPGGCDLFKKYDIEGTWTIIKTVDAEETTFTAVFNGYREYGEIVVEQYGDGGYGLGSYRMEYDTDLRFSISYFAAGAGSTTVMDVFQGGFDDHDTMSGTLEANNEGEVKAGTWTAIRREETL
jgi:hypothetical protein